MQKESNVQEIIMKHEQELERISGLTREEARKEQFSSRRRTVT